MDLLTRLATLDLNTTQQEGVAALILQLQQEAETTEHKVTQLQAKTQHDAVKIQALTLELAHLKRLRFGVKNEALSPDQRDLFRETMASDCAAIEAEVDDKTPKQDRAPRERAGRQPLPEQLPRIDHHHEPERCTCGECGGALVKIGEDISEQLDVIPAQFIVHRHIRPQYACRPCESITAAPIPAAVIDGGMAAPGLITWVLISKFLDHLPLYRLEQIAARDGVTLARSTLSEWVGRYGVALQPLADRLAELLRQRLVLHADETPVQQLDPGKGKTKRAYLWAYRSNDLDEEPAIAVFDYQTGRSGVHARNFLDDWQGHLVVDDYAGYKALFASGGVIEVGCMAHARRKFEKALDNDKARAEHVLGLMQQLYGIEARAREEAMGASQRKDLRQQEAVPLVQELEAWLADHLHRVAPKSPIGQAISYTINLWPRLKLYAEHGKLEIDNNLIENQVRPLALGRKNYLFAGSHKAAQRAAIIYSLLGTCKLNGVEPLQWLTETLSVIPDHKANRLEELLPGTAKM
jgi:transposase